VGTFATDSNGEINIPLTVAGNYTVIERQAPQHYLLSEEPAQNVTVVSGETAQVVFENAPYGNLRVEKVSSTGENLAGAGITIQHIESGQTYSATTNSAGCAMFTELKPGAYRIQETTAPAGYILNDTVYTTNVNPGETSVLSIVNEEKPGLRISKYDSKSMEALADVTFEIFRDGVSIGKYQTNQLGEILLTDLKPGTYLVQEVASDASHVVNSTPQQIELSGDDGILELVFLNDQKPGIHLVKLDATSMQPLPNATFRIEQVGGTFSKEYVTDANGEVDLTDLEPGAYTVTELEAPDGYLIDDAARIIQINGNEDAQFVFTNTKKPALRVVKLDSYDSSALAGTTFRIAKIEDGSHYLDRVTDTNGEINISDLEPGVYSVQEIKAPEGYVADSTEYHVELFAGKTSELVVSNDRKPDLEIIKTDAITGEPVQGVTFTVKKADSSTLTTVTSDANGKCLVEDLDPGVYEVWEKSVPDGYLINEEHQLITLVANRTGTVQFQNYPKPSLTIQKVDSITGDPIKGAKFSVTYGSNNTFTGEINDLGTYYTDENGQINLTKLQDGWYKVTELEPASGYAIKDPATQEIYVKAGTSKTLTFENTPLSALVVYKYDSVTGEAVQGAVFQVKYLGGTSGTGGTVIGTYKTSANGSFTVTGLKAGTYVVEELASDSGHVIDTAPQTAYISGEEQDVVELYFGNSPKGALLVKKVDSVTGAPISDVEFMVTTSDGTVVGDANGKFTTDSAGTFTVSGITPGTTLVVKETQAKSGYVLDDTPQTAKILAGQTVTLEFRNAPKGNLIINKLDSVTKKPLAGVQFKITYANGSYVDAEGGKLSSNGLYTTDSNGQIVLSGITGTVVVTEVQTIEGYTIDENTRSQTVVVNPDDTQTLTFYNTPIGGVELIKVNADDKAQRIANTTFEIRKMDGGLVDTVTTDENGRVFLSLESGSYYAVEIEAAKGYKLDNTPHYFTVKDGKTTTVTITNKAISGILIHKTDSTTGNGIYGVTFLLYDANNTPVGQYTSDDQGYVYIENLEAGRYYLRELENEGYVLDTQKKTVYVQSGETTEVEWQNTPITGQIQLTKTSADYNSTNGWAAGTPIPGTEYEIYNKAGNLVDTIRTDKNGVAGSKALPLGRYKLIESKAADFYALDKTPIEVEIEFAGQIVRVAATNKSINTNVSITKTGYSEVMPGQTARYTFSNIGNNSTVSLTNFYWRDTLPTEAVRLSQIITGTYNAPGNYKIVYRTNLSGSEYLTLADNLSTSQNYTLIATPVALKLASNEYVTEVMMVFGTVPAGFKQVEAPKIDCTVVSWAVNGLQFVNQADVGGTYNGAWVQAISRWTTKVYAPVQTLPRTGY
jgi:uncharacterized surface anchored protein